MGVIRIEEVEREVNLNIVQYIIEENESRYLTVYDLLPSPELVRPCKLNEHCDRHAFQILDIVARIFAPGANCMSLPAEDEDRWDEEDGDETQKAVSPVKPKIGEQRVCEQWKGGTKG